MTKKRSSLAQELSEVETRKHRLVDAIARGEAIESLLTQLKAEEQQARLLAERLSTLSNCEQVTSLNRKQLSEELKRRVADIRGLLSRHVSQAKQMTRKLVPQLDCTPFREGDKKGYRFSGNGSYGQLLSGESSATKCGVPSGEYKPFNPTSRAASRAIFWRNQGGCLMKGESFTTVPNIGSGPV